MLMYILLALSTALSTIALVIASLALRARLVDPRTIDAIALDHQEIIAQGEMLSARMKRLNARVSMREARAKLPAKHPDDDFVEVPQKAGETAEEWKARMRREIALGKVKHG